MSIDMYMYAHTHKAENKLLVLPGISVLFY